MTANELRQALAPAMELLSKQRQGLIPAPEKLSRRTLEGIRIIIHGDRIKDHAEASRRACENVGPLFCGSPSP